MNDGSTDEADAGKATRWAEGCRRHKAIGQLVERHKQPLPRSVVEDVAWELGGQPSDPLSLNVLVPGSPSASTPSWG